MKKPIQNGGNLFWLKSKKEKSSLGKAAKIILKIAAKNY